MKPLDVCAAVIRRGNRFLLATRPADSHLAGNWEFPGGKLRSDETPEECIRREIREELGMVVLHAAPVEALVHHYPGKTVRLHFLDCTVHAGGEPQSREAQQVGWFTLEEMTELDLADADRRFCRMLLNDL